MCTSTSSSRTPSNGRGGLILKLHLASSKSFKNLSGLYFAKKNSGIWGKINACIDISWKKIFVRIGDPAVSKKKLNFVRISSCCLFSKFPQNPSGFFPGLPYHYPGSCSSTGQSRLKNWQQIYANLQWASLYSRLSNRTIISKWLHLSNVLHLPSRPMPSLKAFSLIFLWRITWVSGTLTTVFIDANSRILLFFFDA